MKYEQRGSGVLALNERPIAFQRYLVDWTGSIKAALLLSQLIYWSQRTANPGGWVYKTREQWEQELGLTRNEQESARRILKKKGLIEERLCGMPRKTHFRVVEAEIQNRTLQLAGRGTVVSGPRNQLAGNRPASWRETGQLVGGKPTNQLAGNRPANTETTTENTDKRSAASRGLDCLKPPGDSRPKDLSLPVSVFARFSRQMGWARTPDGKPMKGTSDGKWSRLVLEAWERDWNNLCRNQGVKKAERVLKFWMLASKNPADEFVPCARTLSSFVNKFFKIRDWAEREKAKRRRNGEEFEEDTPEVTRIVINKGKVRPVDKKLHEQMRREVDGD